MKKTGIFFSVLFFLFYYERYEVIDVRNYQSAVKSVEVKGEVPVSYTHLFIVFQMLYSML